MRRCQTLQSGHKGFCFISSAYHGRDLWARLPSEGYPLCAGDQVNFDSRLSNRPPFCGEPHACNVTRATGVGNRTAGFAFGWQQPSSNSHNPTGPSAPNVKPETSMVNPRMVVTSTKVSREPAPAPFPVWTPAEVTPAITGEWLPIRGPLAGAHFPPLTGKPLAVHQDPVADGCITETTRITCKRHTFETVVGVIDDVCRHLQ